MCRPASSRRPGVRTSRSCARSSPRCEDQLRRESVNHIDSVLSASAIPTRAATTASTAAASCPRRWWRRSPSSRRPTSRRATDEAFRARARASAARLRRPADAALRGAALERVARRRADLPQARGPRPHRRAQDQQRARPGAAGAADGQAADHRRDRRRPARRRDRDGLRAARPRLRRLHGRGRHGAPVAERLPHAAARREGAPGRRRQRARSRTRSTKRCATGSPTSRTATTCSARCSGRIRTR